MNVPCILPAKKGTPPQLKLTVLVPPERHALLHLRRGRIFKPYSFGKQFPSPRLIILASLFLLFSLAVLPTLTLLPVMYNIPTVFLSFLPTTDVFSSSLTVSRCYSYFSCSSCFSAFLFFNTAIYSIFGPKQPPPVFGVTTLRQRLRQTKCGI